MSKPGVFSIFRTIESEGINNTILFTPFDKVVVGLTITFLSINTIEISVYNHIKIPCYNIVIPI